jgi:hypothetical protein
MSYTFTVPSLRSSAAGTVLIGALYLGIAIASISLLCSLIQLVAPDIYNSIEILDGLNSLIQLLMMVIAALLFLIWMYQLHTDLRLLFKPYPITSGEALAGLAIPVYNLWGTWNVFSTLANRLKSQGGELAEGGSTLRFWLPFLYIVTIASRILSRVLILQERQNEQSDSSTIMLMSLGLDVILWFIWLEMVKVIRQAVSYKFTQVQAHMDQRTTDV